MHTDLLAPRTHVALGCTGRPLDREIRPRGPRPSQQVALSERDTGPPQRLELIHPLDALGDHARSDLAAERDQRPNQRGPIVIAIDAGDHLIIQLQEIRRELDHVAQTGVAGAGVIDRKARPGRRPGRKLFAQERVVVDGRLLGHLDHQPVRHRFPQARELRLEQGRRAHVREQEPLPGGTPSAAMRRQHATSNLDLIPTCVAASNHHWIDRPSASLTTRDSAS